MIFYKHFIGDYQRDTGHLSLMEHGAYRLLMDTYYATEKPLPSDEGRLFRLLKAIDPEEQDALRTVLGEFWEQTDGGWINARARKEMEEWHEFSRSQSERGKRGGRPRKNPEESERLNSEKPEETQRFSSGNPGESRTKASHSHSQSQRKDSSNEESQRKRTGTRLPKGWEPTPEDIAYAQREGFTDDEIGAIAEDFTDYWIAQPGQKGRKSDWSAVWRTWIRRERKPNRGNGRYSHARDKSAMFEGLRRSALKDQAEPASGREPDWPGATVHPIREAGAA